MEDNISAALSQLAYLELPPGANTLGKFVAYYTENPDELPENDRDTYIKALNDIAGNKELMKLPIAGHKANKVTGFSAYAFGDSGGDGIVAFRGSGDAPDWINNVMMETSAFSPQEIEARAFLKDTENGAGNLKNIDVTGHSLGGYLTQIAALFDERVNSATTYNAPGMSSSFLAMHPFAANNPDTLKKIKNIRAEGDVVSLIGEVMGDQITVPGTGDPKNILGNHSMGTIMKGMESMDKNNSNNELESIGLLGEAMKLFQDSNNGLSESVAAAWETVQTAFDTVWGGMPTFFMETIPEALAVPMEQFTVFGEFMSTVWEPIGEFFSSVWDEIILFFTETIPSAVEGLQINFTDFSELFNGIWPTAGEYFAECWNGIIAFATETIPQFVETVAGFIAELPGRIWEFLCQIANNVIEWVANLVTNAQTEIPKFIECIVEFFRELPGKIWEHFVAIVTNLIEWVQNLIQTASEQVPLAIEGITRFFSELPGKIWGFLVEAVTKIGEWAGGLINKAGEVLPGVISSIMGFFEELPGKLSSIGTNMVQGIWNGINNAVGWVMDKIKGFASRILDGIKGIFGIHSPSAVMRDQVGKNLALGVAEGISKNTGAVSDAMSDMADVVAASDLSVEPEVTAKSLNFEAFKEKLRPSIDFVKTQLSHVQEVMTTQFSASAQLAAARTNSVISNNNMNTNNYTYTINSNAKSSPVEIRREIERYDTFRRMAFAK